MSELSDEERERFEIEAPEHLWFLVSRCSTFLELNGNRLDAEEREAFSSLRDCIIQSWCQGIESLTFAFACQISEWMGNVAPRKKLKHSEYHDNLKDEKYARWGEHLKIYEANPGMSQKEVAKLAGCSETTLKRVLQWHRKMEDFREYSQQDKAPDVAQD